ncbi:unconventional myosin-XVIIIa [Hyalella azteca]|uniref:Unconventional myosin-XVIIIa n=1 Tax=Hyalella azteca TaxID=294128 RepID=A0A8B7PBV8_HYAAZ|nr:unconventional myosin-XVIIIa [Hyalella azteca]
MPVNDPLGTGKSSGNEEADMESNTTSVHHTSSVDEVASVVQERVMSDVDEPLGDEGVNNIRGSARVELNAVGVSSDGHVNGSVTQATVMDHGGGGSNHDTEKDFKSNEGSGEEIERSLSNFSVGLSTKCEDVTSSENNVETNIRVVNLDESSVSNHGAETRMECPNCRCLEKRLADEEKQCAVLRANIHKVSANWFQRKTQLSESETDVDVTPVGLLDQTTKIGTDDVEEKEGEGSAKNDRKGETTPKSKDFVKMLRMIAHKSAQLEVSDSQCHDLKRRLRECEKIIDDKDDVIHGLKDQLETYLNDNQQMSLQLNNLAVLFQQLEKSEQQNVIKQQQRPEEAEDDAAVPLPTSAEYKEMSKSVSKTYIKLRDLIYEKKALVTEIERLNTLNVELQKRVVQQETRLMSVTDALHQTWLVVSDLKEQHAKLHDDELIMRYELKQKRNILTKLRRELESSRAQWQLIRQKNQESEEEYASIREMLRERRKESSESVSMQEPKQPEEPDEAVCLHPEDTKTFDPPVDLLLEMGLEYGIIGEEAEMTQTVLEVIRGEDIRHNRLEQLEEHCSLLYQKLLASTSRSLFLASRLSTLHRQFGSSDEEEELDDFVMETGDEGTDEDDQGEEVNAEDGDDDGEEEGEYYTDADRTALMESVLSSPVSEEYDTAYVSEAEAGEPHTEDRRGANENLDSLGEGTSQHLAGATETNEASIITDSSDAASGDLDESCDHLSRTLINFLPRKIEFLTKENRKLEAQLKSIKEEKEAAEERILDLDKEKKQLEEELKVLAKDIAVEKLQRQQLEGQLKHLGKCVDQLKLDHQKEGSAQAGGDQSRSSEERRAEEERVKREVAILKREMEVKRREKEVRKREEDLVRREEGMKSGAVKKRRASHQELDESSLDDTTPSCVQPQKAVLNLAEIDTVIQAAAKILRNSSVTPECPASATLGSHESALKKASLEKFSIENYASSFSTFSLADDGTISPITTQNVTDIVAAEFKNASDVGKSDADVDGNLGKPEAFEASDRNPAISKTFVADNESFIVDTHERNLSSQVRRKREAAMPNNNEYNEEAEITIKDTVPNEERTMHRGTEAGMSPVSARVVLLAPTIRPDQLPDAGVSAEVYLAPRTVLLVPMNLGAADASASVHVRASSQDVQVAALRLSSRCGDVSSTTSPSASSHASPQSSLPASSPEEAQLAMPVMRVMRDESINITITAHQPALITILITNTTGVKDGAVVRYAVH